MSRQHSIVTHKPNYFYRILEDDYLLMYEMLAEQLHPIKEQEGKKSSASSDCKALITSIVEHWMNSKRSTAKSDEDLEVYFTIDEWLTEIRHRYGRNIVTQCLQEMEEEGSYTDTEGKYGEKGITYTGTLLRRHHKQNTFAYRLNLPVIKELLAGLPEQSPFELQPRPMLGRPRKNHPKINGLNLDGIPQKSRPKINGLNLNCLKVNDEPSQNKRYYDDEGASEQDLRGDKESTKITSNYKYSDSLSKRDSSAILEEGALNALPIVTQQPAHPMESMRASNESTNHSLPIATPTTGTSSSLVSLSPVLYERSALFSGSDWDAFMDSLGIPMEATDTPQTQHNGSDVSSTHPPVDDIPSQPTSPPQDAGSGLSSDAAVTTSNTDEQRDGVQGTGTSEVVQGSDTGLSTKETQEKAKDKIVPEGAENSTVPPKKGRGKKALEDITALPKPERPPEKMIWGVPKCLLLATFYRGYPCPSKRCEEKAKHGAISLIQQGRTEQEAEGVLRYMKCLDKQEDGSGIYDGWWEGKEVDIWHVAEHCAVKLREIERKKKEQSNGHAQNNGKAGQVKPSLSSFDDPNYRVEDEFYPDHHERSAHYATFS